ncbi:lysophospholipid acyltransferase family protein, partial [Salmonella enterica]|uniref:lysophospholipid acyltransferase family protein n=3 Tax=Pseudomonadota TaxID=1224 RepID=UPI003527A19B
MRSLRAVARLLRLLVHILAGLATVLLRFPRMAPEVQHARVQVWSRELLAHAGIALEIRGTPLAAGPALLVANHLSWLDISVMHAARHCRFISKSDVERWPVIGRLATAVGTLYIERSTRRDAMRIVRL